MAPVVCVFCGVSVRSPREHILPKWFFKSYESKGKGPFVIEINGEPVPYNRSGEVERDHLSRVMLPVCGQGEKDHGGLKCNDWLNTVFEQRAKDHFRMLLDDLQPITATGVQELACWAVKTLLLYAHPAAVNRGLPHRDRKAWTFPDQLLPGMRATGRLPEDLSLWCAFIDPDATQADPSPDAVIMLPRLVRHDGAEGLGQVYSLGFGLPNRAQLVFQLVSHPLLDVKHPFEEAGLAVKLWPDPPASLDLTSLPVLDLEGGKRFKNTFSSGGSLGAFPTDIRRLPDGLLSPFLQLRGDAAGTHGVR